MHVGVVPIRESRETYNEYLRTYRAERRIVRRSALIAMLGGKCVDCGATDNLEFNHIDPSTKLFSIGDGIDKKWETILDEVAKCDLRCVPHHRELTSRQHAEGLLPAPWNAVGEPPPHGSAACYAAGCREDRCRQARSIYRDKERRQALGLTFRQVVVAA